MAELRRQGWVLRDGHATFEQSRFPCQLYWEVNWIENEDVPMTIYDIYTAGCL